ncbi:hypothetical protein ACFL45_10390, partial [Candidatus Neomarinimicrobiota bacterium]
FMSLRDAFKDMTLDELADSMADYPPSARSNSAIQAEFTYRQTICHEVSSRAQKQATIIMASSLVVITLSEIIRLLFLSSR